MPQPSAPERHVSAAQVAEVLGLDVDEVVDLIMQGRLRGARLGVPPRWRVAEHSVHTYLAEQREEARRMALWRQSNTASFPELWGVSEQD